MSDTGITTKQHVRNVLVVLSSAIFLALSGVAGMVYYYGPDGSYQLNHVLLEPGNLARLNYTDVNPATGRVARYTFDRVDFSYVDAKKGKWQRHEVGMEAFASFYSLIKGEKSVGDPAKVAAMFDRSAVAVLSLRVHLLADPQKGGLKEFQEVQFLENGDHYRVEVHSGEPSVVWAYFYHPGIYQKALQLFQKGAG